MDKTNDQRIRKQLLFLIAITSACRLFIASSMELGNAEAYYWVYATRLQWNYYDHPPAVAWLIRLTTANLLLHCEIGVRIGAVACSAISTWIVFEIGRLIHASKTGWYAALLYTSSIYASIAAGCFILPDSPQLVFWLSAIFVLLKLLKSNDSSSMQMGTWCVFGVLSGLCIMSKLHGVFLWIGLVLYGLVCDRSLFKNWGLYLSFAISLTIISPAIVWNFENQFVNYRFYTRRVNIAGFKLNAFGFIHALGSVIMLTNPINFFLICRSLRWIFSTKMPMYKKETNLILCCSLPLIIFLLFLSFFRETLPHWSGPAYTLLLILPALHFSTAVQGSIRIVKTLMAGAIGLAAVTALSTVAIANYWPGTTASKKDWYNLGEGDASVDMYGWHETASRFKSLFEADIASKQMPPDAPIIVTNWFSAAHIDFYVAKKTHEQTIALGELAALGQYLWLDPFKKPLKSGDAAYYIVSSNALSLKIIDDLSQRFDAHELALTITHLRGGTACKKTYIFRFKGFKQ